MPLSTQQFFDKLKAWGLPHAAGLAGVYSFCAATGVPFLAFIGGALASSLASDRVQGIFQGLDDGIDPDALQKDLAELSQGENERALEELITTVTNSEQFQEWLTGQVQNELIQSFKKEVDALQEKLTKSIIGVAGAAPFDIRGSIGGLLKDVSRVANHGLINVIDRFESQVIVDALQGRVTRQVFLRGRALSGKTFLAFKVAQRWIVSGGQVAWMRYGADITNYIATIQTATAQDAGLPLIVWEAPHTESLKGEVFDQLQRYDGPVLTTVRVGGLINDPSDLDEILEDHGFKDGGWKDGRITPTAKKVSVFLGPIADRVALVSAIKAAGKYDFKLKDDGKAAIAKRILVGVDDRKTTLLGLAKAYLMAFDKQGVTHVDQQAVHDLEGPNREALTTEKLVKQIFSKTVDEQDKQFLTVLKLYKAWTFVEAMHEDVLTAALVAYQGLPVTDRREQLTNRGVLIYRPPWYSAWHDLQLDVLPQIPPATVSTVLNKTIDQLSADLEATTITKDKVKLASATGEFASELRKNRLWNEALKLHQGALATRRALARAPGADLTAASGLAATCNNLAILLKNMGERDESGKLYQEALDIRRELAKEQPRAYLPDVAATCNNLGILLSNMGERDQARELYQEALDIRRELAEEQPRAYLPNVATVCNNLGTLLAQMGEHDQAGKLYQEALDIRRELSKEQPRAYLPNVSMTCNNLGILLKNMGERDQARELFQKALDIRRELAEEQPRAYLPSVAATCNDLGLLLAQMGEHDQAGKLYQEALDLRRELAEEQPRAYLPSVAATCNNLGLLLAQMGEHDQAGKLYQEALDLRRELAEEQPKAYLPSVAATCNNLGLLLAQMGEHDQAGKLYQEALDLRRELAEEQPRAYLPDVAMTCHNQGSLLADMGAHKDAASLLLEALSLHFSLNLETPKFFGERLGATLRVVNELANDSNFDGRENWLRQTWEQMLEAFKLHLLGLCKDLGDLFKAAGFPALALEPYLFARLALEKLNHPDAAASQTDVESLRADLGQDFEPLCQQLEEKFAPMFENINSESQS